MEINIYKKLINYIKSIGIDIVINSFKNEFPWYYDIVLNEKTVIFYMFFRSQQNKNEKIILILETLAKYLFYLKNKEYKKYINTYNFVENNKISLEYAKIIYDYNIEINKIKYNLLNKLNINLKEKYIKADEVSNKWIYEYIVNNNGKYIPFKQYKEFLINYRKNYVK